MPVRGHCRWRARSRLRIVIGEAVKAVRLVRPCLWKAKIQVACHSFFCRLACGVRRRVIASRCCYDHRRVLRRVRPVGCCGLRRVRRRKHLVTLIVVEANEGAGEAQ